MSSEDLLDHYKLDAEVHPEYTLHASRRLNKERGIREKIEIKWNRIECIGQGAFGEVWKELQLDGNREVRAVKTIEKQRMKGLDIDFKKELLALAKLDKYRQEGVFGLFFGWFENERTVFLAMEYFEKGDLNGHMMKISTEDEVRQIATHLLEGLKIMHQEGFTHRDLKPQNIFVVQSPPESEQWWVKIGDFGISKRVKNEDTQLRTQIGTPYFQAPEIQGLINDESSIYTNAVDMWSLGCIVYNLSAQRKPFLKPIEIVSFCQNHSRFPREPLYPKMTVNGIEFIQRLLIPQPTQRMPAEYALKHPWILQASPSSTRKTRPSETKLDKTNVHAIPGHNQSHRSHDPLDLQDHSTQRGPIQPQEVSDNEAIATTVPKGARDTSEKWAALDEPTARFKALRIPTIDKIESHNTKLLPNMAVRNLNFGNEDWIAVNESNSSGVLAEHATVGSEAVAAAQITDPDFEIEWKQRFRLKGHSNCVTAVAFSPDGRRIASASYDRMVRLWDATTGASYGSLEGHNDDVTAVAFSPDGKWIATGSNDKTVRFWDAATGRAYGSLRGHKNAVRAVVFSPDGKQVAPVSDIGKVKVWDVASDRACGSFEVHKDSVMAVAFSPDGKQIAVASDRKVVRLWDVATEAAYGVLKGHKDSVTAVAFSPDGKQIASGSKDGTVRLWDAATRAPCALFKHHKRRVWVSTVTFSPNGKQIASTLTDKTVALWDVETGEAYSSIEGIQGCVTAVVFSPDWRQIAYASDDRTVRLLYATAERRA